MKINPVAIQSYQQVDRRDSQAAENAQRKQGEAVKPEVTIEPKEQLSSKLAVKGPAGTYADYLNKEEQKAMELLFARFQETGRLGQNAQNEKALGRVIDVKV